MPTLNWIGKEAVVEHHKEVPFQHSGYNGQFPMGSAQVIRTPNGECVAPTEENHATI